MLSDWWLLCPALSQSKTATTVNNLYCLFKSHSTVKYFNQSCKCKLSKQRCCLHETHVNQDLQDAEERRLRHKSMEHIELLQKEGGRHAYTPMWQMYDVRFKVYTSPVHKPVTSARYTDIQPQHTISLDIKSIPFFSITPRDSETCTQAIIKSWWGWHLTLVLILSCFPLSFFFSSFCVWRNGNEPWQLLRSRL